VNNSPNDTSVETLLGRIRTGDKDAKAAAVGDAAAAGVGAILPLADVMAGDDPMAARAAQESLHRIAYHCGGKGGDAKAASQNLVKLIGKDRPRKVRVDALHLLGFVAQPDAIRAIAAQLADPDVREDARMSLERIPGKQSEAALRQALKTAPADCQSAIQQSLRHKKRNFRDIGVKA
jgi:HEAT repeat protein